jgi:hypothetical protein
MVFYFRQKHLEDFFQRNVQILLDQFLSDATGFKPKSFKVSPRAKSGFAQALGVKPSPKNKAKSKRVCPRAFTELLGIVLAVIYC